MSYPFIRPSLAGAMRLVVGSTAVFVVAWFTMGGCATGQSNLAAGAAGGGDSASATGSQTSSGSGSACTACLADTDCAAGSLCAQFGGDAYCAPDCSKTACSDASRACTTAIGADGTQLQVCIPKMNVCSGASGAGGGPSGPSGTTSATGAGGAGGSNEVCGSLRGPDEMSCCTSCKQFAMPCEVNGCYGGYWCNVDNCKCQAPPSPASCGGSTSASTTGASTASSSWSSTSSSTGAGGGSVGPNGGTIGTLSFAIVGDTRPATEDDTANYPNAVIKKIWQDVEAQSPRPAMAISTGDYQFAKPFGTQSPAQIGDYLAARAAFSNIQFPAMGNHECTGQVTSNCGQGNADGITNNYTTFLQKMLAPIGQSLPYYVIDVNGPNNVWTAKFVFVAANAWNSTQSAWLSAALAKPTTYTFVVRHEGSIANTAPGVTPSATIMAQHPYTLLVAGHTHTYAYYSDEKQIIVGNGGAPLSGNINYGYVIATQRADGAIAFKSYDYSTNAVIQSFAVKADGTPTP